MKKFKSLVALLFIFGNLYAQDKSEKNAFSRATEMAKHYNNKDFKNYVNCLLPITYGKDTNNKVKFAELWERMTAGDTSRIQIIKVLKSKVINDQHQALILNRFRNEDGYIFGVSNDKGENWFFTTSYSKDIQFEQISEVIPSIDTSFARIIDPRFGKRFNYEVGEMVAPFKFININGNILSSDSLQGKVIVLNFWFIACGPCIMEIPELNKLVENMKGKEVVFIAPAILTSKEQLINKFLPKQPFRYQITLINKEDYSITSFPTHIVIDKNQKVVDRITGYSPDNINNLKQKIGKLLDE